MSSGGSGGELGVVGTAGWASRVEGWRKGGELELVANSGLIDFEGSRKSAGHAGYTNCQFITPASHECQIGVWQTEGNPLCSYFEVDDRQLSPHFSNVDSRIGSNKIRVNPILPF